MRRAAVIPGANVTVINSATGLQRETTTTAKEYFLCRLSPSSIRFRVERTGFAVVAVRASVLNVGDQKALQIQLKAGDINATVQVVNDAP